MGAQADIDEAKRNRSQIALQHSLITCMREATRMATQMIAAGGLSKASSPFHIEVLEGL